MIDFKLEQFIRESELKSSFFNKEISHPDEIVLVGTELTSARDYLLNQELYGEEILYEQNPYGEEIFSENWDVEDFSESEEKSAVVEIIKYQRPPFEKINLYMYKNIANISFEEIEDELTKHLTKDSLVAFDKRIEDKLRNVYEPRYQDKEKEKTILYMFDPTKDTSEFSNSEITGAVEEQERTAQRYRHLKDKVITYRGYTFKPAEIIENFGYDFKKREAFSYQKDMQTKQQLQARIVDQTVAITGTIVNLFDIERKRNERLLGHAYIIEGQYPFSNYISLDRFIKRPSETIKLLKIKEVQGEVQPQEPLGFREITEIQLFNSANITVDHYRK